MPQVEGVFLADLATYLTAAATLGLLTVATATALLAWWRFRRETLDISVTANYGGVSGQGYSEEGFRVSLINKGTQYVIIYSAGYHVTDDIDDRNFQFYDEHYIRRPANEGDAGAVPRGNLPPSTYKAYQPSAPYQTVHSEFVFPIRIPPGGIYSGFWAIDIERHRNHLSALQNRMHEDYYGLWPVMHNPIPYVFFSTIYGTKRVMVRPFGRFPRVIRCLRLGRYYLSGVVLIPLLRQWIFSEEYDNGYWIDRLWRDQDLADSIFFPPASFSSGVHPMSIEENERRKKERNRIKSPNFHQITQHIEKIAKGDGYIETANYSFKVATVESFNYGLLKATVERPKGHLSYNAHSFLQLNMLLGLRESWAYPEIDTALKQVGEDVPRLLDSRYYLIPHERE